MRPYPSKTLPRPFQDPYKTLIILSSLTSNPYKTPFGTLLCIILWFFQDYALSDKEYATFIHLSCINMHFLQLLIRVSRVRVPNGVQGLRQIAGVSFCPNANYLVFKTYVNDPSKLYFSSVSASPPVRNICEFWCV